MVVLCCQPFWWPLGPGCACAGRRNEARHSWSQELVSGKFVQLSYESRREEGIQFLANVVKAKGFSFKNVLDNAGSVVLK